LTKMNIGEPVKVITNSIMKYYPCTIKMFDEGEYYVCCEFGCMWLDENDIEVGIKDEQKDYK